MHVSHSPPYGCNFRIRLCERRCAIAADERCEAQPVLCPGPGWKRVQTDVNKRREAVKAPRKETGMEADRAAVCTTKVWIR